MSDVSEPVAHPVPARSRRIAVSPTVEPKAQVEASVLTRIMKTANRCRTTVVWLTTVHILVCVVKVVLIPILRPRRAVEVILNVAWMHSGWLRGSVLVLPVDTTTRTRVTRPPTTQAHTGHMIADLVDTSVATTAAVASVLGSVEVAHGWVCTKALAQHRVGVVNAALSTLINFVTLTARHVTQAVGRIEVLVAHEAAVLRVGGATVPLGVTARRARWARVMHVVKVP